MRKSYIIQEGNTSTEITQFTLSTSPEGAWTPANRVITDSDEMAFLYVIDENDAFSYLVFKQPVWTYLAQTIQAMKDPKVVIDGKNHVLTGLYEELESLLFNIEGNSNYGEAFVNAVEETFSTILEEA